MIVYVDMDGVLADFEQQMRHVYGKQLADFSSRQEAWRQIESIGHWFKHLHVKSDADQLVQELVDLQKRYHFSLQILTALPSLGVQHEEAFIDKMEWVNQHFPLIFDKFNVGPFAIDKQDWATEQDVLIDDSHRNISQWNGKGGIGILHTSAITSIKQLTEYLNI